MSYIQNDFVSKYKNVSTPKIIGKGNASIVQNVGVRAAFSREVSLSQKPDVNSELQDLRRKISKLKTAESEAHSLLQLNIETGKTFLAEFTTSELTDNADKVDDLCNGIHRLSELFARLRIEVCRRCSHLEEQNKTLFVEKQKVFSIIFYDC